MRKTFILAAFAALISLASCQKEGPIESGKNASPVFTASIAGATKTTVNVSDGKVVWETNDEITVTDASSVSAVYTVESIDATTGKAIFVIKDGETALGDAPYTATYGTEPATTQTYSETAVRLFMTAPATSDNSFSFTVQCGLMKLNLTKAGESVKSISVTGTPEGGSETTYTLTCTEAQSIASAKDFFIALPEGSYTRIVITNSSDKVCTLNSAAGVAVAANHIKPVTFGENKIHFVPALPAGALPGVFTVSNDNGTTKTQIYFSQGNLYYDGSKFNFEANQYSSASSWDASHVSHFYWSKTESVAYAASYRDTGAAAGDVFFTNETVTTAKEGFTVNVNGKNQPGWRTLSTKEWQYLFNTSARMVNGKACYSNAVSGVSIGGSTYKGVFLYPDNYNGEIVSSSMTWDDINAAGIVFLPAAGSRNGSLVSSVGGSGSYWSSTALGSNSARAYLVCFDSHRVTPGFLDSRGFGYSVRLITECQ